MSSIISFFYLFGGGEVVVTLLDLEKSRFPIIIN